MKPNYILTTFLFIMALLFFAGCAPANEITINPNAESTVLTQLSTYSALNKGIYTGEMPLATLSQYGNFGIGTFDGLDGEMILLDGKYYQAHVNGSVNVMDGSVKAPYADVIFFQQDKLVSLDKPVEKVDDLKQMLDQQLPVLNKPYAFRIDGTFSYLKLRSVPKQSEPYPPLSEAVKNQTVFEFENLEGTMVGFRLPDLVEPVGVAGYHFHFISKDRQHGGHVLDTRFSGNKVSIDNLGKFWLILPENEDFQNAKLTDKK